MTLNSYWSAYSNSEQSFTDTSYTEKHTLNFTAPAQGDYLIMVSFLATTSSTSYSVFYRTQLDNSTTIMEGRHEPNNAGNAYEYRCCSTIYLAENLASGAHYVDIDCYIPSGATGYIKYAKIIVLRLDDALGTSGMYAYSSTEGTYGIRDSGVWHEVESLTFTPDQAGDYLILASVETRSCVVCTASSRLNYDSASEYIPLNNTEESGNTWCSYEAKDTGDYYSWVWGGIINIPASEKTILMESIMNTYTDASDVRKRRILAIRLGAIGTVQSNEDASVTTSRVMVTKSTITWTPSNAVDHLILGCVVVKPDATAEEAQTVIEQTAPSSETIQHGYMDAKDTSGNACCTPYFSGIIKELTTASTTFRVQYGGRTTSDDVYAKACWVVAIEIESGETTAYKDVSLKTTLESALTYKDITLKTTLESISIYKDVAIKTSFSAAPTLAYKDIALKTNLESALTYKDINLKTTLESTLTYKDIALKTTLESALTYKDIALKTTLESIPIYKDIALKTSFHSLDYKDVVIKTSFSIAPSLGYKDVAIKTSLELGEIIAYKDITLKTSLESILIYKDITLKTTLESGLTYKDIAVKTSLESALNYKDIALKTTLESALTYKDISLKITLDSLNYKDIVLKTSLESSPIYKDVSLKTSLRVLLSTGYKDIALKISFTVGGFKDICIKVSLEAIVKEIINFTSSINLTNEFTSSITQTEEITSSITQTKNFISKIDTN